MNGRARLLALASAVWIAAAVTFPVAACADLPSGLGPADDIGSAAYSWSNVTGHFSVTTDTDDVVKVYLYQGDRLEVRLERDSGTGAVAYLYPPSATSVNGSGGYVAVSVPTAEGADILELTYVATESNWHFIDVSVPADGLEGDYTLYYSADSRDEETGLYDTDAPPGIEIYSPPFDGLIDNRVDPDDVYWVPLYAGENITAKLVDYGDWDSVDLDMYLYKPGAPSVGPDANSYIVAVGQKRGTSTERITYTPSTAGDYLLDIYAYAAGTEYEVKYACLTKPSVGSTLRSGSNYKVSSYLYPKRTAGTKPVTIVCQKLGSGGKVVSTKTFSAKAATSGSSSKCTASVKLTKGTWKIKARRTDSTLGTFYSGSKTVKVK